MSVTGQMLDEADAQAALYFRALEDLTCLVEHTEGLEECPSPTKVLRNAITLIEAYVKISLYPDLDHIRNDTIRALEVLAHRFEEIMDREDLDL